MKENKLLIASVAVMIAAMAWSVIATTACVMLDRQKEELTISVNDCQADNQYLRQDTAWMMDQIRKDIQFLEQLRDAR